MPSKKDDQTTSTDPVQEANEKGYLGTVPDKTPNSAYTFAGSDKGDTPEEKAAQEIAEERDEA